MKNTMVRKRNHMISLAIALFVTTLTLNSCETENRSKKASVSNYKPIKLKAEIMDYQLDKPKDVLVLPKILKEISALAALDSSSVACVQDEIGAIFIYDIKTREIKHKYKFLKSGDFEGISIIGSTAYVLRSDGVIFEIENFASDNITLNKITNDIPAKDFEGLCYDNNNNRLLIVSKSPVKDPDYKNTKPVFAYDLDKKKFKKKPVFEIDYKKVENFAKRHDIDLKHKKKFKFRASAIAIHPETKDIYLLAAVDNVMLIYSKDYKLKSIRPIAKDLFRQAEGITFLKNGDMLISNEGGDGKATILKFSKH